MSLVVGVTGHKPDKLGGYKPSPVHARVINDLTNKIRELKPDYVVTGMDLGVGQWTAEICRTLGIPFVAALPYFNMEQRWPELQKVKFNNLLAAAYQRYYITQDEYKPGAVSKRNKWIVDSCQVLVAVFDGSEGNTSNCVSQAEIRGMPIHRIFPGQYDEMFQQMAADRRALVSGSGVGRIPGLPPVPSAAPKKDEQEDKIFNRSIEI